LKGSGLKTVPPKLRLYITDGERQEAWQILSKQGIKADNLLVGINPGATYGTAKRWPQERYVELSKRLIQELGAKILIFGGPGEAQLGTDIAASIGNGCHNLCNRTNLRQAMALIDSCHAFVTNDSGLMHVAAALGTPQTAIIGPTDPIATGPLSTNSRLLQKPGSCDLAPCLKPHCPTDHRCMASIDVNTVYKAICEQLQSRCKI
jgi:heptosyltransferase-2